MRYEHPPKIISGTVPGKLDPTQPSRVLHHPNSTLTFATYSPFTARTDYEQYESNPASKEELLSGCRIVVETSDLGECIWRFVPHAHLLHGVNDEGVFPRPVHFCNEMVIFSQDQWDIHKLDPGYICTVHPEPQLPTIVINPEPLHPNYFTNEQMTSTTGLHTPPHNDNHTPHFHNTSTKRRSMKSSSSSSDDQKPAAKKTRPSTTLEEVSENGSVSAMSIDGLTPPRKHRERSHYSRRNFTEPIHPHPGPIRPNSVSTDPQLRKRKMSPLDPEEEDDSIYNEVPKRYRASETPCPENDINPQVRAFAKAFDKRKEARLRQRKANRADIFAHRHETLLRQMAEQAEHRSKGTQKNAADKSDDHMSWSATPWEEMQIPDSDPTHGYTRNQNRATSNPFSGSTSGQESNQEGQFTAREHDDPTSNPSVNDPDFEGERDDTPQPEETPTPRASPEPLASQHTRWQSEPTFSDHTERRKAELMASMQKIRELEKDKPLWEAEAQKRRAHEELKAREREAKRQAEKQRRAEEDYAKQQSNRPSLETENARVKKELDLENYKIWHARQRKYARYNRPWNLNLALLRYTELSDEFDGSHFTKVPVTFDRIPWPIEKDPMCATFSDISWAAIESFLERLQHTRGMSFQTYKELVWKTQTRFHPDRWRGRGILTSVKDPLERECCQSAANIVSQAVTPIWAQLKGRDS